MVSWINSGFQGSPSFLSNPGAFFLDVADQITGDFIAKNAPELSQLCSPFSLDIRLALAFKYRPNVQKRYTCTLSKIITNTTNAVQGASINGFTAGDFKQGGWPAFVSLTTEPQNNVYGAYLTAEADLSWRVASAQARQKDEISNGKGFLSWRDPKCSADVTKYNNEIKEGRNTVNVSADGSESSSYKPLKSKLDCPIQTPGSIIEGSLQNNLNGPLRELELADEFNEIVNALFAQLVTQVLQKGLGAVSSKGSDGKSYLDSTIKDLNNENNPQVQNIKTELNKNLATAKKNILEYKQYTDESLAIMLDIKNNYDAAKACYQAKIDANKNNNDLRSNSTVQQAKNAIAQIDSILKTIQDIEAKVAAAKTANDLRSPTEDFSGIIQAGGISNAADVIKAKDDLETIKKDSVELKQDALRHLQTCQLLN